MARRNKGGWGRSAPPTFLEAGCPRGERGSWRASWPEAVRHMAQHSRSSDTLPTSGIADKRMMRGVDSLAVLPRRGEIATESPMREMAPQCVLLVVGCGGWR